MKKDKIPARTHLADMGGTISSLAPVHLTRQEFGKRLYGLMRRKGWTQSELARQAGEIPRDSVSKYVRGVSLPSPDSLEKLAAALGVDAEKLLPNYTESAIDQDNPAFEMKISPNDPKVAWLRINRLVTTGAAVKIVGILEADDAANRSRGSR